MPAGAFHRGQSGHFGPGGRHTRAGPAVSGTSPSTERRSAACSDSGVSTPRNRSPSSTATQPASSCSILAKAAFTGLWAGVLLHVGPAVGRLAAAAGDTLTAAIGLVLSVGLVLAALRLESVCRVPPSDGRDDPDPA